MRDTPDVLDLFVRDIRLAFRQLIRTPAFSISVAATLAIGIGATTSVFAVADSVILRALPYPNADRLVGLWWSLPAMGFDRAPQSLGTYFGIRRLAKSFDGVAVISRAAVNVSTGTGDPRPERVISSPSSASLFSLLGTRFIVGRGFGESEDVPHAAPVAVISEGLWRRKYGADPHVIGKRIVIDGAVTTIVGVASSSFHFPDDATQLWTPLALDEHTPYAGPFAYQSIARLRPGVQPDAARREVTRLIPSIAAAYPNIAPSMPTAQFLQQAHAGVVVRPMRLDVVGGFGNVALIAAAAVTLLFAISLANAATLFLTRAEGRQRELALRVVLGAGPRRVLAQLGAESLLVGTVGGGIGLGIALVGVRLFVRTAPPGIPRLSEIGINAESIAFAVAATIAMAFGCGAVAALRLDVRNLGTALRDRPRGGTASRDRQRTRRTLVVAQVALATLLLSGATLLLQNVERLRTINPGFDAEHTLSVWLSPPVEAYPRDSDIVRFATQVENRVRQVPGVVAVGVTSKIPMYAPGGTYTPVWSDADQGVSATLPPSDLVVVPSGGFFRALGIPVIAGRSFYSSDRQAWNQAIVSRALAKAYWGDSTGQRAIGRRFRLTRDPSGTSWYTVVGVAGSVADTSLSSPPIGVIYLPDVAPADTTQSVVTRLFALVVRSPGNPRLLPPMVERAIAEVDPSVPPFSVKLMTDVLRDSMARVWFVLVIFGTTAAVALLLAAIGLYGVLAFVVNARAREMSIRVAMGAPPAAVAGLVARQGVVLAGLGIVVGGAAFLLLSRYLESAVSGLSSPAIGTTAIAPAVLLGVALLASWIPARRASAADPARALSAE